MRGILLAGGLNTRLRPATLAAPKSLLPIWDTPLIYHPLCALMTAGAREILTIAAPMWLSAHKRLLGDGSAWGLRISYAAQSRPLGIADAYRMGRRFLGGENSRWRCATTFSPEADLTRRFAARRSRGKSGGGRLCLSRRLPTPAASEWRLWPPAGGWPI